MPVVDYDRYCEMLDKAQREGYAYPGINCTQIETISAAIEGFAEAQSDGLVQVSLGAGTHTSGKLNDPVLGAVCLAEYTRRIADRYDINVALHTDHCQPAKVDSFLKPLIKETKARRKRGEPNLFNSHMLDASELPLEENMALCKPMLEACYNNGIILEVEAGVVGGEEDGINHEGVPAEKLYTTPEDMLAVYEALSEVKGARYMFAATFGNVHGIYKPGNVRLRPDILKKGQDAVEAKYGKDARFDLVFHGGSGSSVEEIRETIQYGVVKMNVDTDTQYAFTRPIVDHMFRNYDAVIMVEGEMGNKKKYDPRSYLKAGRANMAKRVVTACENLQSAGKTLGR